MLKSFLFLSLSLLFSVQIARCQNAASASQTFEDGFEIKGFHLDLRIQVMKPAALHEFAQQLVGFGINTLVMEWEASYPYEKHAVISNELSYTKEEIGAFIEHCSNIGLEVIPLQQCLGHVEYILRHDRYRALEEDPKQISQLCPREFELNKVLFTDLFSNLIRSHNSDYIHIGGDEAYLLGHCDKCSKAVEEAGMSSLFVDHMKVMCEIVIEQGKIPVMWADMITKYPSAVDGLPKETIFVDWNYGWQRNKEAEFQKLIEKGYQVWGSPAIRSGPDNWYLTDWNKHFKNQQDFIPYAKNAGYTGVVLTSWSTSGIYGYTWDEYYRVLDMEQVRNVYPLSGFRILLAYYASVLGEEHVISPEQFVLKYGAERFGLSAKHAALLWESLSQPQKMVYEEAELKVQQTANDRAIKLLSEIRVSENSTEFDHYLLMADLRAHYLKVLQQGFIYNSEMFTRSNAKEMIPVLEQLIESSKILDKRFFELNKGFLYESEIEDQNRIRSRELYMLYNRIAKVK